MAPPQFVIFDFDGTLADSFPWFSEVLGDVADRWGFRRVADGEDEALRHMSASAIFAYLGVPRWKVPLVAADLRKRQALELHRIRLFGGVATLLARLDAAGLRLGVASSNATANVQRVLGAELWGLIDDSECGAGLSAKHRRLRRLLRRARLAPCQALYIGDEIRDIEAARRVGMAAGAVTWGYNRLAALQQHRPDRVFHRVHDIERQLLDGASLSAGHAAAGLSQPP